MMSGKLLTLFCFLTGFSVAWGSGFEHHPDGITLRLEKVKSTDPCLMKVQVCSEDIIRVQATREADFSDRESLIIDRKQWSPVQWFVTEEAGQLVLSTAELKVKINPETGSIAFFDSADRLILREKAAHGKIITPAEVLNESTWHVQQMFDSPEDEAFYGLGQHQYGWMNYKGRDVDLYQNNNISVVPFVISSKNYGILWDNNSRTKFGDPADFEPLSQFKLLDAEGKSGGLTTEYFSNGDFTESLIVQQESTIAHANLEEWDNYPEGFNKNQGSIRWEGQIEAAQTGVYNFRFYSSNYAKLWLNGEPVVDSWRVNWMPWASIIPLDMKAGETVSIKVEWIPNAGYIGLTAKGPEKALYQESLSLWSHVADQIDYYFIHGDNPDEVISGYRSVTGKAPMMPKWAMGFWQCRQRYQNQDELLDVVREFRKRKIPLDNIVQDWFYWPEDKWGDHDFDPARFPDPEGLVKELHDDLNTRIMISVWPKFYVGTTHYEQFRENGWLYMRNVEKKERDWVGRGYHSTFYDPYSPGARDLFWKQIDDKLFSKGFDAWWLDATEPDIHSNLSREENLQRIGPTALGTGARYRNTFSLMNAKGIYEGQRQTNPDQRVFILTRSAYAGQQRYSAATWSGDIAARWYDMKVQISAGLNVGLSGIPYWTMDIGGFSTESRYQNAKGEDLDEWREQSTRWYQFGTFCPLYRSHGEFPYREVFNIAPEDHPAYQSILDYTQLRYRLMPYIYSLAGMVTQNDYTIMRALVLDFGQDAEVLDIGDQFMFGPSILVNPVTTYKARKREVYLPAGTGWYDLKSGVYFKGGNRVKAEAPYSDIPLFVKAGSIIPFGPEIQHSDEKPADPIRLRVYTGQDADFTLYEDENVNYNYEKGVFSRIPISFEESSKKLTIGERLGEFPGMLQERTFEIDWITPKGSKTLNFDRVPDKKVNYSGTKVIVIMP